MAAIEMLNACQPIQKFTTRSPIKYCAIMVASWLRWGSDPEVCLTHCLQNGLPDGQLKYPPLIFMLGMSMVRLSLSMFNKSHSLVRTERLPLNFLASRKCTHPATHHVLSNLRTSTSIILHKICLEGWEDYCATTRLSRTKGCQGSNMD